jgi:hypothetical protein
MSTSSPDLDRARLRAIAATDRPLEPAECAERARLAGELIVPGQLTQDSTGEAVLLWREEHSEAWLNLWQPRDTGYHDHSGSCVGVYVISGRVWHEPSTLGAPPVARGHGPGEAFWFPGDGIHRMDHQAGAVTIHAYSPPVAGIGHYDLHDGLLRRSEGLPDQPIISSHPDEQPGRTSAVSRHFHPAGRNALGELGVHLLPQPRLAPSCCTRPA